MNLKRLAVLDDHLFILKMLSCEGTASSYFPGSSSCLLAVKCMSFFVEVCISCELTVFVDV